MQNKEISSRLFCLMGPTASGKSDIALELVKQFPFEIISVDSAVVYRGMDIGTAKPSKEILSKIPHHLIDIRDPLDSYSAADFRKDALAAIKKIKLQEKIPLLVGGTMLYFKALLQGLSKLPSADVGIRDWLKKQADEKGIAALYEKLLRVDPVSAKRIHSNDWQRLQRALEVFEITGRPMSQLQIDEQAEPIEDEVVNIIVCPKERAVIHNRIAERFDKMLEQGFVEEVRGLYNRGDLNKDLPAMRSVGYRQVWEYLEGNIDYETMKEKAIIATRQLAKRQLTWLRQWPDAHWFDSEDVNGVKQFICEG